MARLKQSRVRTKDINLDIIITFLKPVHYFRTISLSNHLLEIRARQSNSMNNAYSRPPHFPTVVFISAGLLLVSILVIRTPSLFLLLFILLLIIGVAGIILQEIDSSLEDVGRPLVHLSWHALQHSF